MQDSEQIGGSFRLLCNQCSRRDFHKFAYTSRVAFGMAMIVTLGLAYFIGPFRCKCCGSTRFLRFNLPSFKKSTTKSVRSKEDYAKSWQTQAARNGKKKKIKRMLGLSKNRKKSSRKKATKYKY